MGLLKLSFSLLPFILHQDLPNVQEPEIFGLHDNVDISKELLENRRMFDALLVAFGSKDQSLGGKVDDSLFSICENILVKVQFNFLFYSEFGNTSMIIKICMIKSN